MNYKSLDNDTGDNLNDVRLGNNILDMQGTKLLHIY